MKKLRVLIVEDEAAIAELISVNLTHAGFQARVACNAEQAQQEINRALPDTILLDWMLPHTSGLSLLKQWRASARSKDVPIIMLTARGDEVDKVQGLEAGADDYITKPFSTQELLARVRAVLRRRSPEKAGSVLELHGLVLDGNAHKLYFQGAALQIGPTEFKLLQYLMTHAGRVHSRAQLVDKVWGDHVFIEERTVDVHVKRLRESLGAASNLIETVRGVGYVFKSTLS